MRTLIALRRDHEPLRTGEFLPISVMAPVVYQRGQHHLVVVNPGQQPATITIPGWHHATALIARGCHPRRDRIELAEYGFGIYHRPAIT